MPKTCIEFVFGQEKEIGRGERTGKEYLLHRVKILMNLEPKINKYLVGH
jgi:hypothetical protein